MNLKKKAVAGVLSVLVAGSGVAAASAINPEPADAARYSPFFMAVTCLYNGGSIEHDAHGWYCAIDGWEIRI